MYRVHVVLDDGSVYDTVVDGRDIRAWEAEQHASLLTSDFSFTMLCELARLSLVRSKTLDMSAAEFDARCVEAREVRDPQADPT